MSVAGLKVCRTCKVEKPVDDFPMTTTPSRSGLRSWTYPRPDCATCTKGIKAERWARRKEAYRPAREKYYHENWDRHDFWRGRTRAKRLGATEFMLPEEWHDLRSITKCHWCDAELHLSFRNVDHIQPLCWGGQHTRENCVMSCANCNQRREWERKSFHR